MADGKDTSEDSTKGKEKIRERDSKEWKKGKKTIIIKVSASKDKEATISGIQKRKTLDANKDK